MRRESGRISLLMVAVLLLGLAATGILVLAFVRVGPPPAIGVEPALQVIGRATPVTITVSESKRGLGHVIVEMVQEGRTTVLAEKNYTPRSTFDFRSPMNAKEDFRLTVGRAAMPDLKPGTVTLRVKADRAATWLRSPDPAVLELNIPVRLTPPTVQVLSSPTYVAQGGSEAVVYRVGESSVSDGVRAGKWWFPGFPLPGGGKNDRFALFSVPWDSGEPVARIVAIDSAGNEAQVAFIDKFYPRPPHADTIGVTDAFLGRVVPEILASSPEVKEGGSLVESYLRINRDLRAANGEVIRALGAKSAARFLWTRAFLPMTNSKVMSRFADRRSYVYNGREIDQQVHLGFDLAVTQRTPVPASNSGTVLLARYLGIYGNTVVLDHGYGLMSLYGHLSEIAVKEGETVTRGQIVGKTGVTGLAGGDHLHFTTLLQGLPVNPEEWWDGHWIGDRIAAKLPFLKLEK